MYHLSSHLTTKKHATMYKHHVDDTENTKEEEILCEKTLSLPRKIPICYRGVANDYSSLSRRLASG